MTTAQVVTEHSPGLPPLFKTRKQDGPRGQHVLWRARVKGTGWPGGGCGRPAGEVTSGRKVTAVCPTPRSAENDTPIYLKSRTEIKPALKNTIPVLSTAITTLSQIKDKVYYRLTHKEELLAMREAVEVWGVQHTITDNL
ncbi:uncharacterized protein LOC123501828 [Portunus trituberculatus]|uniref:uncharacterized protein LOC123501828 n=1 Tax=Portunus trituberculatus TaxID=210409 RepID=UPI001E1CC609|nr:uncharacterized protein LOC123501828 [Portunus trituberculatus]